MTINNVIKFVKISEFPRRLFMKMKAFSWSFHCLKGKILKVGIVRDVVIIF